VIRPAACRRVAKGRRRPRPGGQRGRRLHALPSQQRWRVLRGVAWADPVSPPRSSRNAPATIVACHARPPPRPPCPVA